MKKEIRICIFMVLFWTFTGFCFGQSPYKTNSQITDGLVFARAESMQTLLEAWAKGFNQFHPNAKITLRQNTKLSAEAFDELLSGTAQVAPFVREMFPSEVKRFQKKFGYDPLLIAVATGSYAAKGGTHAIAVYVNSDNPLKQLTLSQIREIYAEGGKINNWGQLGLTGEWADKPINLYGMLRKRITGDPPGIVNFLQHRVLLGAEFKSNLHEKVDSGGIVALDAIVNAVAKDRYGIGYSGFANKSAKTKTLEIAEGEKSAFYAGTPNEVLRRVYPLSRTIYLCVNQKPGQKLQPVLREFLRFTLSREGQKAVYNDQAKFLQLPNDLINIEKKKFR